MREILQNLEQSYEAKDYKKALELANELEKELDPHFSGTPTEDFITVLVYKINILTFLKLESECEQACYKLLYYRTDNAMIYIKLSYILKSDNLAMLMLKFAKEILQKMPKSSKKDKITLSYLSRASLRCAGMGLKEQALSLAQSAKNLSQTTGLDDDKLSICLGSAYAHNARYQEAFEVYEKDYIKNQSKDSALKIFDVISRTSKESQNNGVLRLSWAFYERRFDGVSDVASHMQLAKITQRDFENNQRNPRMFEGKKVVIFTRQGHGDTFMFLRYLEYFLAFKPTFVLLEFQDILKPLMKRFLSDFEAMGGGATKITLYDGQNIKPSDYDYFLPYCSLPFYSGADFIPNPFDFSKLLQKNTKNNEFNVGIYYKTTAHNSIDSKVFDNGLKKSFKLSELIVCLVNTKRKMNISSFQVDASEDEKALFAKYGIGDLGSKFKSFEDTLSALGSLDLLITCDTAIAHLALSAGVRTAVLLPYDFDWRWGRFEKPKSPWYENAHLFACDFANEWQGALRKLEEFLKNAKF